MMIMKKIFNSLFVIIASMVAFSACVKEENSPAAETKTVQFFAESIETKTAFGTPDGTTYPTLWTANDESVKLSLNLASPKDVNVNVSDDFTTANFTAELADDESGAYVFYAMSPASAYNNFSDGYRYLSANISTAQTPLANSVDEKSQVLYAVSEQFDVMPSSVSLNFQHFTAYGKLSFTNINLNGAEITSVSITSSTNIAGRWNYNIDSGDFTMNSGASTIALNTTATENIWFACAPVDMDGQSLTFTINTDKGPLSKTVTLSGKKFEAGKIAKMVVDMSDAKFAEQVVFDLVTDVNDLTVGSEIIIAASASDVAISTTQNSNNRGYAAITKSNDKSNIVDPASGVQVITVKEGTTTGTLAFYVGNGYLYAASSSSNYMRTETTLSANSSWNVTIESTGVATIKAAGSNTRNWLRYNSSNKLFSCYSSGQDDVVIYKKRQQSGPETPEDYLTVSETEINVNADATTASFTVSSNLEWTATSDDADVTVDGNTVNVSFSANDLEEIKTYTVVVAAEGVERQVVTITQASKVVNAVIEDGKYWIVASNKVAKPLSGNYGNLGVDDVWTSDNGYSSLESNAFTFTAVNGGYTIQDATGKYYYMTGTYNNFNVTTTAPADGSHIWTIVAENGTYSITNSVKGKYIQYSTSNASFGSYASDNGEMPTLVKVQNPVVDLSSLVASLSFESEAGSKTITLPANVTVVPSTNNEAFTATASANVVTVSVNAATQAQTGSLTLVISYNGFSVTKIVSLSQKAASSKPEVTEKLDIYANKGVTGTKTISWSGQNFTCTNEQGSSTTAIRTSDSDHHRLYANSTLKFTANGNMTFTQIVVTCTSSSYAGVLQTSATNAGYSATTSGNNVTITVNGVAAISIKMSAQSRINAVSATLN